MPKQRKKIKMLVLTFSKNIVIFVMFNNILKKNVGTQNILQIL